MIVYLDTSALIPLLIEEPASETCERLWDDADDVVTVRIAYVEAAAALAQAHRLERLTAAQHRDALRVLDDAWSQVQIIDVDDALIRRAATFAASHVLRGYDATHGAGAEAVMDDETVAASGDKQLLTAWRGIGLNVVDVNGR
ncbi:type II toxin-antitoxin system VapC family toxin [Jatrophihabitans fulvus]